MMERKSGRIMNISSFAGKKGLPRLVHYCASKFGVIGMTQALALEVAPFNITVNAVAREWSALRFGTIRLGGY